MQNIRISDANLLPNCAVRTSVCAFGAKAGDEIYIIAVQQKGSRCVAWLRKTNRRRSRFRLRLRHTPHRLRGRTKKRERENDNGNPARERHVQPLALGEKLYLSHFKNWREGIPLPLREGLGEGFVGQA